MEQCQVTWNKAQAKATNETEPLGTKIRPKWNNVRPLGTKLRPTWNKGQAIGIKGQQMKKAT
jgi:hypothetical protein